MQTLEQLPEALPGDETLHVAFEQVVANIDATHATLSTEQQEALQAKPAGRKVGGDESNQQNW